MTTITLPADGVDRNTSCGVNGTAYDEIIGYDSGLATLKIQVKGLMGSTTEYWDPPGWSGGSGVWLGETAGESWAMTSTPTWKNGYKYEVRAYHKDEAGNEESPPALNTFIFDTSKPDSSISCPSDPFYGPGLTMVWGSFVDYPSSPSYSSGVSSMTVRIYCSSGTYQGDYWDGNSWESLSPENAWQYGSVWASTWTYTSLSGAWNTGASYIINSRAIDDAGNVEVTISTATFTYDSTEPQTVLSMPEDDQGGASPREYESMSSIYGTASDTLPGQLSRVEVKIRCIDSGVAIYNKYWNSETDDWQDNEYWIGESSVTLVGQNWQFDSSYVDWVSNAIGVLYRVWCRAVDKGGNVDTTPDDNKFKLKSPLPNTGVNSPGGDGYFEEPTSATGWTDQYTTEWVKVLLSSGTGSPVYWDQANEVWTSTKTWNSVTSWGGAGEDWTINISTLAWTDGVRYNITSKGKGSAGEEPDKVGQYFYIDQTEPDSEITSPSNGDHFQSLNLIEGTSWDTTPGKMGKVQIYIKKGSNNYWDGDQWVSPSIEWLDASASDGDGFNETSEGWEYDIDHSTECWNEEGTHTIVCKAEDKVPNTEIMPYYSIDIVIDKSPPDSTITTPSQYLVNSLPEILGTGNDPAPTEGEWQGIQLQILNKDTTWYWQGTIWDTLIHGSIRIAIPDLPSMIRPGLMRMSTGRVDTNIKSPVKPEIKQAI